MNAPPRELHLQNSLFEAISHGDASRFLKTEKLMEAWYCLHNDNITLVVDGTRPRIFRLYTHGKYGDFQNLLYDTNSWDEITGLSGIVPSYIMNNEAATPFIPHAYWFENFGKGKAVFDGDDNAVGINNVECYSVDDLEDLCMNRKAVENYSKEKHSRPPLDFKVRLKKDEISVITAYPAKVEKGILTISLYPLYTHYSNGQGERRPVEYFQNGFVDDYYPRFDKIIGRTVTFEDELNRLPRLTIAATTGTCRVVSHADKERNSAFRLRVIVETAKQEDTVRIRLAQNPITVKTNPLARADKSSVINIFGKEIISCKQNERALPIKKVGDSQYEVRTRFPEGEHEIKVESQSGMSVKKVYGVNLSEEKISRISEAIMKMFWQEEDKKDLIAYMINLDTLKPVYRGGCSYGSHGIRALTMLLLGTEYLGKRQYAGMALKSFEAMVNKSHCFDNGDLLLALDLGMKGEPRAIESCRPSDLGLAVRAFVYAARVFGKSNERRKRKKCLDYAVRYARTLFRMQRDDGAFYGRYSYPDLKPASDMVGTVNNWMIQIWDLAEMYEEYDPDICRRLREMLRKYVDFSLFKKEPSFLEVSGGADEGPANYHDDLATSSAVLTIKYLLTRDPKYKKYAEDAFKMSVFHRNHRFDSPTTYMYPLSPHLGVFYDQPLGLPAKGGMTDLTGNEAGVFLKKHLDYDFGEYVACCCTAATFTDNYKPNGGLYGITIDVPNYYYRRTDAAETLNYGAMGVVLFWLAHKQERKDTTRP